MKTEKEIRDKIEVLNKQEKEWRDKLTKTGNERYEHYIYEVQCEISMLEWVLT